MRQALLHGLSARWLVAASLCQRAWTGAAAGNAKGSPVYDLQEAAP